VINRTRESQESSSAAVSHFSGGSAVPRGTSGKGGCRWIFCRRLSIGAGQLVRRGPIGRSARTQNPAGLARRRPGIDGVRQNGPDEPIRDDELQDIVPMLQLAYSMETWTMDLPESTEPGGGPAAGRYRRESGLHLPGLRPSPTSLAGCRLRSAG
jgi:hypothetical protein